MFNQNWTFWDDARLPVLIMVILVGLLSYFNLYFLPFGLLFIGVAIVNSKKRYRIKENKFKLYFDTVVRNVERANKFATQQMPIGIALYDITGSIEYSNDLFKEWMGEKSEKGSSFEAVFPSLQNNFETFSKKDVEKEVIIEDRTYKLTTKRVLLTPEEEKISEEELKKTNDSGLMVLEDKVKLEEFSVDRVTGVIIYLEDITEHILEKKHFDENTTCLAYLQFDNYDDVMKGLSESDRANISVAVNHAISVWAELRDAVMIRYSDDLYTLVMKKAEVEKCAEEKFNILDKVREVVIGNKIPPTLSIGISSGEKTLIELSAKAKAGLDLAIGRGGDQAVLSLNGEMSFFGGNNVVHAKSTRVRARIVGQAIRELMNRADKVYIMGHANEDYDSIGAAIGVAAMAKAIGKTPNIIVSGIGVSLTKTKDLLEKEEAGYVENMMSGDEAMLKIQREGNTNGLLILVDHHRTVLSASREIISLFDKNIIIDHHRRAEDCIKNSILQYMEPSASSSCELVTELLGYFDDKINLTGAEASCLYSGIVVDTKNFAVQTGERTFEAAAYLRKHSADPKLVQRLFVDDVEIVQKRAELIANAKVPLKGLAISIYKDAPKDQKTSIIISQAADELLKMEGVVVSVVMAEVDSNLAVSARSNGDVNVQVIMEELGGGGHQTVAGVQIKNTIAADIMMQVKKLVKEQLKDKERDNNESNLITGR